MAEVASAFVSLMPSAKGFGKKLNSQVGGEVSGAGKKLGTAFGKVFVAAAGGLAVGGFIKDALGEGREAQKVAALTAQVIKTTGAAANVTAKDVDNLASSISRKTGIDDEQIASAQNLLLTFKDVRNETGAGNDIFNQATQASVDMASAMAAASGGAVDFRSSSTMLGKALNDPIKGLSAMSRVGIQFTEGQKEQITSLVETGQKMKAQKVILAELQSQFGGAAQAQATAGDKARVAWGNFQEAVGSLLLPAVDRGLRGFTKLANFATDNLGPAVSDAVDRFGPKLREVASLTWGKLESGIAALRKLTEIDFSKMDGSVLGKQLGAAILDGLDALAGMAGKLGSKLGDAFAKVDWVGLGITIGKYVPALLLGLAAGILNFDIGNLLSGIGDHWVEVLLGVLAIAFAPSKLIAPVAKLLSKIPFVGPFLARAVTWFNEIGRGFGKRIMSFIGDLGRVFGRGFGALKIPGAGLVKSVLGAFKAIPGQVANFFKTLQTRIGVWALDAFEAMGRGARKATGALLGFVTYIPRQILKALGSLARFLSPRGSEAITGLLAGIKGKIPAVVGFMQSIPGRIIGLFTGAGTWLYNAGIQLMSGLASGITSKIESAINAVRAGLSKIRGLLPGSPIKWGPLKNWNNGGAGKRLMDLVTLGITKGTPKTIEAAQSAFGKIGDALKSTRSDLQSTLDGLKSDFASLADSVAQAFTGDLFGVTATEAAAGVAGRTVGENFFANLIAKRADLTSMLSSFKTLQGWGLAPSFLSQLFASGNGALITELAGMGQSNAQVAGQLFTDVTNLGAQLGGAVATNDPVTSRIDETNRLLTTVSSQLGYLGSDIGKELNGVAAKAQRDKKNKKGRK